MAAEYTHVLELADGGHNRRDAALSTRLTLFAFGALAGAAG